MSQIKKKFLETDSVDGAKIKLANEQSLRARNAADSADVNILKLDSSDIAQLQQRTQMNYQATANFDLANKKYVDDSLVNYVPTSQKGAANGVATLDGSGKIPASQLTVEAMEYKGAWNASTNSPSLANGTGSTGDVYAVSVAGSTDFGAGAIAFSVGDWVIYNGSIWQMVGNSNSVTSVNSQTGAVVLNTDNIAEGATNKYFSDERAQDAVGAALTDSATVDFTYNDGANTISAIVIANSISETHLTTSVAGAGLAGGNGTALSVNVADGVQIVADVVKAKVHAGTLKINGSGEIEGFKNKKQNFTLVSGDITNQYIDLSFLAASDSVELYVAGVMQAEGTDYTLSVPGSVTRITFAGDLATGGNAALIAGDIVRVKYMYL